MSTAVKTSRVPVAIDRPLYEQIRRESKRQKRTIREATNIVITTGLAEIKREQQQQHAASGT